MADITFDTIKKYFDLPISHASRCMRISDTYLKKVCRKFNISRWPYRRLCFLKQKLYHALSQYESKNSSYWRRKIEEYQQDIDSFYNIETITRNNKISDNDNTTETYEPQKLYYSIISPDKELDTMEVKDSSFGLLEEFSSNKIVFVDYSPTKSNILSSEDGLFLKLDVDETVKILSAMQ